MKQYVLCILVSIAIILTAMSCDDSSNNDDESSISFNSDIVLDVGSQCLRLYGENDCGSSSASVASGAVVGTVSATHQLGYDISYTLTGNDNFAINSSSGQITAAKALTPAADTTYTVSVKASANSDSITKSFTITNTGITDDIQDELGDIEIAKGPNDTLTNEEQSGSGAGSSSKYIQVVRGGGIATGWGGTGWTINDDSGENSCQSGTCSATNNGEEYDLSSYSTINFSYKVASGGTDFRIKIEDTTNCSEIAPTTITKDGEWHSGSITLSAFTTDTTTCYKGAAQTNTGLNAEQVDVPFYIFLTADGTVDIDEIYFQ